MSVSADTQITDLAASDHACLTFGEPDELFDLTAAFVRDGLAGGLKVIWLSDVPAARAAAELARRGVAVEQAAAAGQMTTAECEDCLLAGQAFAADRATDWLAGQIAECRRAGYPGLRVAVDMSWALRPVAGIEQLPGFEEGVAAVVGDAAASVLCQYDRERFDPVTLASVAAAHNRSVAAATYHHDAVLRICRQYAPAGIRLAGEADYQAAETLALALAEAIRLDGDITVSMTGLSFIDASCMRMILGAARSLDGARAVLLECSPAIAARFALLEAADPAGIRLVTVDGR